jgi:hypothetical protein
MPRLLCEAAELFAEGEFIYLQCCGAVLLSALRVPKGQKL